MNRILTRSLSHTVLLTLLYAPFAAHAEVITNTGTSTSGGGLVNPLNGVSTLPEFLRAILGGVVQIGTIVLIMMLVYVGFLFVVARGNAEKLQSAKSALVWTVIGGLILLGATSIQLVIEGTVNSLR
ncbi:MAG TPA: hypothetical protein VGE53_01560 [Candidatus Paceibacterota bacterium]